MSFNESEVTEISVKSTGSPFASKAHNGAPAGQLPINDHQTTATTKTSHRTSFLEAEPIASDASNGEEVISFETPTVALPPNSYAIDNITIEGNADGLFEAVESDGTVTVQVADELSVGQFDIVVCMNFLPSNPYALARAPQVISRQQRVRVVVEAAE